jgi:GNAT superfamily N-acetyltransferase
VARAVLGALEATAREAGKRRMILETGDKQPEAIGLYESAGYLQIPNFGYYKDAPGAVCFGREL